MPHMDNIKTCCRPTMVIMSILFCLLLSQTTLAQVQRQDCMDNLQPCLSYLNGNRRPPDSCCRPLDYVIKSAPECLCSLMSIQGSNQAEQAGINVTDAQTLPGRCGLRINPLGCITGTPDTRSSSAIRQFSSSSTAAAVIFSALMLVLLQSLQHFEQW